MPIKNLLKKIAGRLPKTWQSELKRGQFAWEIARGHFLTDEKEYAMLSDWVTSGDWVLDVGANIGHYTAKLSELVGASGRVISFEPVPETFALLAANVTRLQHRNVTLINMAVSDSTAILGMEIPSFDSGLENFYMANITADDASLNIMALSVDSLKLTRAVSLVKIDAEGHELSVLEGMVELLRRDMPVLIVEDNTPELKEFVEKLGYASRMLESSSNRIFEPIISAK